MSLCIDDVNFLIEKIDENSQKEFQINKNVNQDIINDHILFQLKKLQNKIKKKMKKTFYFSLMKLILHHVNGSLKK